MRCKSIVQLSWQLCDRGPTIEGLKEINLILAKQTFSWRTKRKECGHIKKILWNYIKKLLMLNYVIGLQVFFKPQYQTGFLWQTTQTLPNG